MPVESTTGLTVETLLLLAPSLGFLGYLWLTGTNHMGNNWRLNWLIAFSGIVTVVPLLTFTLSLRRLPLLAISFIQFLSPTVQMIIAVTWLGEPMMPETVAAFVCIWIAVAIFIGDAVWQVKRAKRASRRHCNRANRQRRSCPARPHREPDPARSGVVSGRAGSYDLKIMMELAAHADVSTAARGEMTEKVRFSGKLTQKQTPNPSHERLAQIRVLVARLSSEASTGPRTTIACCDRRV